MGSDTTNFSKEGQKQSSGDIGKMEQGALNSRERQKHCTILSKGEV